MTQQSGPRGEFWSPLRVYIEDTDAGGIVYYVNYLKFMERARTEMFRELGFPKPAFISEGLLLVVASAQVDYKAPARLDEVLQLSTKLVKCARSYVVLKQKVFRDESLLCEGLIKVACVTRDTLRPRPMPDAVATALKSLEPDGA